MHKVYITGSSIVCALGNNKNESIKKLKTINETNYKEKNNYSCFFSYKK